ncbi:outer membrane lipoprotein-sorting protein [Gemmatimonadota bacterium]
MRSGIQSCVALAFSLVSPHLSTGQEDPRAQEIADKTHVMLYAQGVDLRATVHMRIISDQGAEKERVFSIARVQKRDGDARTQRYLLYFHEPRDLRRMSFLVWKSDAEEDQRWMYVPGMDLVRRIAARDARKSFAGSTLYYEDITGRDIGRDSFTLLPREGPDYLLKAVPRDPNSVEFSYYTILVDGATFLPKQIEYFEDEADPYRRFVVHSVLEVESYPTVVRAEMQDEKAGTRTVVTYSDIRYGLGFQVNRFHEGLLRMPPVEFIR